jgi:hypothetical protein
MNLNRFGKFQDAAQDSGVLFYYCGDFTEKVTETVGEQLRLRLESEGVQGVAKRKIFSTFVEMAHNVLHYGEIDPIFAAAGSSKLGVISMGVERPSDGIVPSDPNKRLYWMVCSNIVLAENIGRITEKLNAIRSMSLDEIKASYKKQIINDEHAAQDDISKGAGLGLLTIARDSKLPLEYSFSSIDDSTGRYAYFFIKAVV